MNPQTLPEWEAYIQQLAGDPLRSKAINANSQAFTDMLLEEGFLMAEVKTILTYFVRQLVATGQALPGKGAFDLYEIAQNDSVASVGMLLDDTEVEEMAGNPPPEAEEDSLTAFDDLEG